MSKVKLTDRYVATVTAERGKRLEVFDQHVMGAGLMLRVTDTGRKVWMVRYRTDDGQQRRLNLGLYPDIGLSEARGRAVEARRKAVDGDDPAGERKQRRAEARAVAVNSFTDLAESYFMASRLGEWKPRKKKKRASTLAAEKWLWTRHIRPYLGDLPLEEVTPAAIKKVLRALVATGRESTSNKVRAQIRQMFNFAIAEERILVNPVAKTTAMGDEVPRQRVLNDDEIRTVWTALSNRTGLVRPTGSESKGRVFVGEPVSIALKLLLVTMVRRAEVSGTARTELDLDNGVWLIPGTRTKSGRPHLVPLGPMAVALFRRAIAIADDGHVEPSAFVFPSPRDRKQPVTPAALTHALRYVREALGLERLTPHDLRRTAATVMASERLGVSPFLIGKLLSHSTELGGAASVTLTTYALYDYVKEKRVALAAWEALLGSIVGLEPIPAVPPSEADTASSAIGEDLRKRLGDDPALRRALITELLAMSKL
ncbi:integrase arm-type DNA-binding domain-containing protein [Brevundimonas sp.]|uniref:tyrosine-type recombinase/integrase n=1 Tax=Brevundimonas sp. TaxID=1871086 RepID=UPI00286B3B6D|nr:integrase arm-type DNA-binding domain-containing protein [Brevundimonas sp.]